jgi:beta-xylosidase
MSAPPVDLRDFPDPFVFVAGDRYLAFATNAGSTNVQAMVSGDLQQWRTLPDALPRVATWAVPGFTWAPVVLARGRAFVLYYTVREPRAGRQAISFARASTPAGPYIDTTRRPFVYQEALGGSIDASPFVDDDGRAYLLWKADANAVNRPSSIWLQPLSDDGGTLLDTPARILDHDEVWESPLIEAPSLIKSGGTYYLFYSANWWNSDRYAVGYATARAVAGPYQKATTRGPWFASDAQVAGPGGQEWFLDGSGQLVMAYHGWAPSQVGYPGGARTLRLAPVSLVGGAPVVVS